MRAPKVSVIIPAFNAERYIEKCLLSFEEQTFRDFEIIVVDDASSDQTSQIAKKHARVLKNEINLGEGASRNIGARAARGWILSHTDSDVVVPPTWLEKIVDNLERRGVKAVAGGYCGSIGDSFIEQFAHLELVFRRRNLDGFVSTAVSNNFACYRDVFFECGGFPERFKCEDLRLSYEISKRYKIFWDNDNGVSHHFRSSLKSYLKQQYFFGRDTVWVYYSYPEILLRKTHQGRGIYLETIMMFFAIVGLFLFPVFSIAFLASILLLNYGFLSFLKKERLSIVSSSLLVMTRDFICVLSVFSGIGLVLKDRISRLRRT